MVLEFGVLYELLVNALKPYSALIDLGKMLFRWAAVFLILAAFLTAFATTGSGNNKLVAASELLQRTVRLMQCGLLLLFFGLGKAPGTFMAHAQHEYRTGSWASMRQWI